jgi:zinc transport system substrate-binding protein
MIPMKILPISHARRRRAVPALLAASVLLAACGGPLGSDDPGTRPRVVASFYPLAYVAERVVGEHGEVVTLTAPGAEPHDLEMTVRQTAEVVEADLVVYERGFQPAVDEAVEQNGPDRVVEATEVVDLAPIEDQHEGEQEAEQEAETHPDEGAEEHAEHADVDGDLHFWLDPLRLVEVAAAVQARMSEIDPDNSADYEANLAELRGDLDELDRAYQTGLAECELGTVVVSHDAFGYLEKYGLDFEPIAGLSPDAEPSPAHMAALANLIQDEGVTTVFSETLASPAMAETLAGDLGLTTAVLDPVEGLSDTTADEEYLSLMQANLQALQEANRCR